MSFDIDQSWIEAVMLAAVRMTAFVVIAPPFSYNAFPARVKAMVAIGLALAVSPAVTHDFHAPDTAGFLLALVLEAVTGAALGFLVMLVFSAIQSAGTLIDQFGGFQLAQGYDPQAMVNGAQFTRLFQMTALALLFASDGYQLVLGGLTRSFTALPLGAAIDTGHLAEAALTGVTQMMLAAVQIAGPLIVVLFLADAGLGLITRVAPALNAFALGFPLKILLTVSLAGVVFVALPGIIAALTGQAVGLVSGVN
ncbi:flagellar biosynthetic protein FliR [Microbacterium sp. STN6]|uniref:flagellar biosynthetic protein FliR n=1 Tax=Microbacterium sp. STN6 TaxID=2995588 RepID=UPI002260A982|nr:flagellar biosynthetic protein FliR [Microbacterium sp. STN6]MCX7522396.1 flagellar biosynthetic protein FliR [Microbacterium sp. STN6]